MTKRFGVIIITCMAGVLSMHTTHAEIQDLKSTELDPSVQNPEGFIVDLDGKWEFYWKEFLSYDDFYNSKTEIDPEIVEVPAYWTEYVIDGKNLPAEGYATYRKKVYLPEGHRGSFGLSIPVFDDSYRLYINNNFLSGSGNPAESKDISSPGYKPLTAVFEIDTDSVDIILHIANYYHRRGGFWKSMFLGTRTEIIKQRNVYAFLSNISIGMLLAFSVFFLFFFLLYRKNYISLFFSLVLMGILIRMLNTDTYPILLFNPDWLSLIRAEYLGSFLALIGGIWFFLSLFPSAIIRKVSIFLTILMGIQVLIILTTPVKVFSYTMFFFQPVSIIFLIYYLIRSLIGSLKGNHEHLLLFIAIFIFSLALINDILIANSRSAAFSDYTTHLAVQIFVFIQAIIVIRQWIIAFKKKEELNKEIEYINANLGKLVKERTSELNFRNLEIKRKNAELQAGVELNQRFFSILAHDLRSPISSIYSLAEFLYQTKKEPELKDVFKSMRSLSDSSLNLIENLLYWGRSQGNNIKVNPEELKIADLLYEVYDFFEVTSSQKQIKISISADEDFTCYADRQLLLIILRNLVSNAIKFTPEGGEVHLKAEKTGNKEEVLIAVEDSGKGMTKSQLRDIKKGQFPESTYGTMNEKGSGLGLQLCFELIKLTRGRIIAENNPNGGTIIKVYLNCN